MTDMGYWQYWHLDKVSEELANNAVKLEIWKTIRGYIENDGESSSQLEARKDDVTISLNTKRADKKDAGEMIEELEGDLDDARALDSFNIAD